jgi:hypothetical protein
MHTDFRKSAPISSLHPFVFLVNGKVKVKFIIGQTKKAQRGSRDIALLFP